MPSLTATVFQTVLGALSSRHNATNEAQLLAAARPADDAEPSRMGKEVIVEAREVEGRRVFTVRPRDRPVRRHILYLHGGGYVNGPAFLHWWFIERLVKTFDARCIVPRYPLAPASQCDASIAFVAAIYRDLVAEVGAENLVVMGDSAGGGLALALLQNAGVRPAGLLLNAPWLDAGVSDPSQPEIERNDWLLNRFVLRTWGKWWAGSRGLDDPMVSPLFGDLSVLPRTLVFGGSRDILVADGRRLAKAAPDKVEYVEEPGLMHVYPLLPFFPETRRAWRKIRAFMDGVGRS
jgi:epsilon-lactone hydrolase